MRIFLFIFLLVLTHFSLAQKKHWINTAGIEVKKDIATNYYTISKTDSKTYIYRKFLKENDSLSEEVNYPTKERLSKEGTSILYFNNGVIAEKGVYFNNLKSNIWSYYNQDGKLEKTVSFIKGIKKGKQTDYYNDEKAEAIYRYKNGKVNGLIQSFDKDGVTIFKEDTSEAAVYSFVDEAALFPGGKRTLELFLKQTINKGITQAVYISFNVDSKGVVTEIEVDKLTNKEVSKEDLKKALKIVAKMPQWEPAMKRGRVVKSRRLAKIEF